MGRPVDWHPLAESDPVPGDVHAIRDEAVRLRNLAQTIQDQVVRLRAIGADTDRLKGRYADKLRSSAGSLAGKLDDTHGRYAKVSGYLSRWADDLDGFQSQSLTVLHNAQQAQGQADAHQPPAGPPPHDPTPAQQTAETAREKALSAAQDDLRTAHTRLNHITGQRDDRARYWSQQINHVIDHDKIHDSGWDKFKNWVDNHAKMLSDLANIIGWVASACALLALIPGLQWLALVSAILTGVLLVIHVVLALAGDGSWVDVGLDVLALATFGVGKVAGKAVEGAVDATRGSLESGAEGLGKAAWTAAAKGEFADQLSRAGKILASNTATDAERASAKAMMSTAVKGLWAARKGAASDALDLAKSDLPKPSFMQVLKSGDVDGAKAAQYFKTVSERFPASTDLATAMAKGTPGLGRLSTAFRVAEVADGGDKFFGTIMPSGGIDNPWSDFKETCTHQWGGSSW